MTAQGFDDGQTRSFTPLTAGTRVAHYEIISKIGAGGMGEVYLAHDTKLDRKVALKFLSFHLSQDKTSRARFTREAKAAAKLDHPNIVPVHEVGEYKGRPFFAMAHIEGQSLREVIKQGKLSVQGAIDYCMQICEGLNEAHTAGVVHRDIKPGNIIIDTKNKPRILDFGLATLSGEEKLTKTGSTLGTVGYMSPEQITGKDVDHRSDIFSIGVILYEMLTGRRPFEGDNDTAVARSITDTTPEPVSRYKSGVSGELQQVVDKALSKDPTLRYQTADGLLSDLRRLKTDAGQLKTSKIGLWAGAAIMVLAAVAALYSFWPKGAPVEEDAVKMLAVLPFENLGSAEDEYFADGITDEITSRLAKLSGLGVISRTSAMKYKNTDKTIPQIGKELGVDFILEGTIFWDKSGDTDRVRIIPQLIQVSDDRHLWSESYQRALTQIFALQADIAISIANELDVTLLQQEHESLRKAPTANIEAYRLYLRGRSLFYTYSRSENEQAIEIFKTVVGMDSLFSLAFAGLSLCYTQYHNLGWDQDERWMQLAEESARRAISLDGGSAEAHFALGFFFEQRADFENMEREMQKALEINPNHAHAHDGLGDIHSIRGELDDAIREFSAALTIDPFLLPSFWGKAEVRRKQGRFRDARATIQKALLIDPENPWSFSMLGNTYRMMGKFGQSLEALKNAAELWPDRSDFRLLLGLTHLEHGSFQNARREANKIHELTGSESFNFEWNYLRGRISLKQGEYADAMKQFKLILASETISAVERSHAHFALGESFLQMSDYRAAIAEFNRVGGIPIGRFQHDYPWARRRYKLGICYEALGEIDSAMAQYGAFLDIWRDADDGIKMIEDAKARLAKLKASL